MAYLIVTPEQFGKGYEKIVIPRDGPFSMVTCISGLATIHLSYQKVRTLPDGNIVVVDPLECSDTRDH